MKKYLSKKYQKAEINFENITSTTTAKFWNLAKRLDQGHRKTKINKYYGFIL